MKNMNKEATIFKNRIKKFDMLAYASMLLVILVVSYPRETDAAPKEIILLNDPVNVNVVNTNTPVSVGSYFFSQSATSTATVPAEFMDSQMVNQTILITGVDISTLGASGSRCTWLILRDTADIAGVGGITVSATLIHHVVFERGTMHHELAQPARVSANQSFHIKLISLGNGSCAGQGIIRFVLD